MIPTLVGLIRSVLVPILVGTAAFLTVLTAYLVASHLVRRLIATHRRRIIERYRPLVDALTDGERAPDAIAALARTPKRHRGLIADELLALLRVAAGATVIHVRKAALRLDLVSDRKESLDDSRWWCRAEAARALGCVGETSVVTALVAHLDDDHEEVRAAAVEALGRLGDPQALPPLVAGLWDDSGLQRTRVVLAIREFGAAAVEPLLEHERRHHAVTATIADLLGAVGEASALEPLTEWCSDAEPEVRAAALRALGTLGTCDRTYYYALRALNDEAVEVRAAAARALARSRRREAAPYLGQALRDEWEVAVESAHGLRELGEAGRREFEGATHGPALALARQMLWELDRRPYGAQA